MLVVKPKKKPVVKPEKKSVLTPVMRAFSPLGGMSSAISKAMRQAAPKKKLVVNPKKISSVFKAIKKSEFRQTPPSMYMLGKGDVPPAEAKTAFDANDKRMENRKKRDGKILDFVKSIPSRIGNSIKESAQRESDFRGRELQRYHEDRAREIKMKTDRSKEEQDYLEGEQARNKRMKGYK